MFAGGAGMPGMMQQAGPVVGLNQQLMGDTGNADAKQFFGRSQSLQPGPQVSLRPQAGFARPHSMQQPMQPATGPALIDEFQQMNMNNQMQQHQQQNEFERMYADAKSNAHRPQMAMNAPAAPQWAKEFEQQQNMNMNMNQMNMNMNQMSRTQNANPMMGQMNMMNMNQMSMMNPMMGMNMMNMNNMNMYQNQPNANNINSMLNSQQLNHLITSDNTFTQKKAETKTKVTDAAPVTTADSSTNTMSETAPAAPAPQMGMGMGGMGMDAAMVEKLLNSDNPKWKNSKFLKFISKFNKGEIEFKDNTLVEKTPEQVAEEKKQAEVDALAQLGVDADEMENAFGMQDDDVDGVIDTDLHRAWDEASAEEWVQEYGMDTNVDSQMEAFAQLQRTLNDAKQQMQPKDPEYQFKQNNKYRDNNEAYELGVQLLKQGKIKEAIKAFEAAVQIDQNNAEAWRFLGQAQAENEDEANAIAALLKCVSVDPYNLPALMMLGVSYTNDLEDQRALTYLKTWLLNNPDYQGIEEPALKAPTVQMPDGMSADMKQYYDAWNDNSQEGLHEQVREMFQQAIKLNDQDADLHTVLGVLHHISSDFDSAINSFKRAVQIRPDDPQLWNKLGATQANSSRSKEAVHAYKRALQLRPTYVRVLSNLAISFANQGLHEDAARTYLATLAQNPKADHVWSYLRISLSHLGKDDLVDLTSKRDVKLFRKHFKF